MYKTEHFDRNVPLTMDVIHVQEIHFHLGDILPGSGIVRPGLRSESWDSDKVTLKVIMHYSDPQGRDRTKTMTLPATTII
jgi:hypothetical protein